MINVSSEYVEKMKDNRDFRTYAEVTFPDGEALTLDASQFTVSNNKIMDGADNAEFPLGVAVLKYVQIEILNDEEQYKNYSFTGARIRMYIDYQLDSGTERIEKGTYTVITPETYGETVVITAYDDMYRADRDYTTNLSFPQTAGTVLRDICSTCDILLGSTTFLHDSFIISEKPTGTFREVIGYIAMIACGNARIDRRNYLQIMSYDFSGWETEGGYHLLDEWKSPKIEYNDAMITGFSTVIKGETSEEDTEIRAGTDDYMLSVTNPLMTGQEETVLSWLHERISGTPVRPFSGDLVSNPLIEFMDLCKVKDRRGNEYNSFVSDVSFVFFGYTSVSNSMPSAERNSMTYNSDSAKVERATRKLLEKEKTDRENAIENLNNTLKESSGMYTTYEEQADGSIITYLHDKRTLAESEKVIKITSEAIGVSNDGGETYPYGLHLTGELLTKIIYTIGLNADYIDTGAITVRDAGGEIIFQVDMDTRSVIISGDSVKIGEQTVTEAVNDALDAANEARNLNIILSNEYQGIPTDYEGNYETFPEVKTTVQVLYGHADVSADCSYSVQTSDDITGTWNRTARTYTVTGLSADTGWVDITATYLTLFSVTKRFKIAKVKDGEPGDAAGGEYKLDCSAIVIKQGKSGELTPDYLDFNAYYRAFSGTEREFYQGRFRIEETADGKTWETVYESPSDEPFVRYSLYTFLVDSSGYVLLDNPSSETAVNYALANTRQISGVRCTLYAAGGFTDILDSQTIATAMDIDALTHEEIFNLLTDDGQVKAFIKVGNQIYINATYVQADDLRAISAKIGGWSIDDHRIYGGDATTGVAAMQRPGSDNLWTFAAGGKSHDSYADCPFRVSKAGKMYATDGEFAGAVTGSTISGSVLETEGDRGSVNINGGLMRFFGHAGLDATIYPTIGDPDEYIAGEIDEFGITLNGTYFGIYQNNGAIMRMNPDRSVNISKDAMIAGDLEVYGDAKCSGIAAGGFKSRIVETQNYGNRMQFCYEMPSAMFGAVGSGTTDEDGICVVEIDPVFAETVNSGIEYHVFLQKEGSGDIWVEEKETSYFTVKGTPGLPFSWEAKMYQKDYEFECLEEYEQYVAADAAKEAEQEIENTENSYIEEISRVISEQEGGLDETS